MAVEFHTRGVVPLASLDPEQGLTLGEYRATVLVLWYRIGVGVTNGADTLAALGGVAAEGEGVHIHHRVAFGVFHGGDGDATRQTLGGIALGIFDHVGERRGVVSAAHLEQPRLSGGGIGGGAGAVENLGVEDVLGQLLGKRRVRAVRI